MSRNFGVFVDLQCDLIFIFVNIFVNIFNCFYNDAKFCIDVNLILTNEIQIIQNDLTIVYDKIIFVKKSNNSNTIIISMSIN